VHSMNVTGIRSASQAPLPITPRWAQRSHFPQHTPMSPRTTTTASQMDAWLYPHSVNLFATIFRRSGGGVEDVVAPVDLCRRRPTACDLWSRPWPMANGHNTNGHTRTHTTNDARRTTHDGSDNVSLLS